MKDPKGVFKSGGGSGEESEPCISKSNHVGGIGRVLAAGGGHKRKKKRMQKGEERAEMCLGNMQGYSHINILPAARQNQENL